MAGKIYPDAAAALDGVLFDGMTIMSGGFGLSGNPENLIPAIKDAGVKDLTIISNNCGADGFGLWMLVSLVPVLRRPLLLHRVAPYVLDVSAGARDLVARRRVSPTRVLGVVASPIGDRVAPVVHAVLGAPEGIRRRLRQAASAETVVECSSRSNWGDFVPTRERK